MWAGPVWSLLFISSAVCSSSRSDSKPLPHNVTTMAKLSGLLLECVRYHLLYSKKRDFSKCHPMVWLLQFLILKYQVSMYCSTIGNFQSIFGIGLLSAEMETRSDIIRKWLFHLSILTTPRLQKMWTRLHEASSDLPHELMLAVSLAY